jgi:hypothetical protein
MSRPRPLVVVIAIAACVVAVALGLAASGCGSGEDAAAANGYVAQVNRAQGLFKRAYDAVRADLATPTSTAAQDRRALDRLRRASDDLAAQLRRIHPPASVVAQHRRLVADVRRFDPAIERRRAAVDADARTVLAANTRFSGDLRAINEAIGGEIDAINAKLQGG